MAILVVSRVHSEKDASRDVAIIVDGSEVGRCKNGCGIRVDVPEGDHDVQAVMAGSWKSPSIVVRLSSEETVELECGVRFEDSPIRFRPVGGKEAALIVGTVILAQYGYRAIRNYAHRDQYLWLRHR